MNLALRLPPSGRAFGVQLVNDLVGESEDEIEARQLRELQAAENAVIDTFRQGWAAAVASGREREFLENMRLGIAAPALSPTASDAERYWGRAAGLLRLADQPDLDPRVRARLAELGRELLADPALGPALRQDFEGPLARQFGESDFSSEPRWIATSAQLVAMADALGITPRSETEQLSLGYALLQLSHGVGDSMGVGADTLARFGADPRRGAWGLQQSLLERMRALPIVRNATTDGARLARTIDTFANSRNGGWQRLGDPATAERFVAGSLDGRQPIDRAAIDALVREAGDALEDGLLAMSEAQRARVFAQVWTLGMNVGALTDGPQPTALLGNSWLRSERNGDPVLPTQATFDPAKPEESIAALRAELEARARRRIDTIERAATQAGRRLTYFELQITWPQFQRGDEPMFRGQVIVPPRAGDVVHRAASRRGGRTIAVNH